MQTLIGDLLDLEPAVTFSSAERKGFYGRAA